MTPIRKALETLDYALLLPALAHLPRSAGRTMAQWRGALNARLTRDWRSTGLGFAHVATQSRQGFVELAVIRGSSSAMDVDAWVRQRFATESREEFEGRWIAAGKAPRLTRDVPEAFAARLRQARDARQGVLLLTPHFDSFMLGIVFLGLCGLTVNVMTSSVTHHPKVPRAIQQHFWRKYRAVERHLHGGRMVDVEDGIRPFHRMLTRGEALVVLADAPAVDNGARITPQFLGCRRALAGGAWRMAQRTGSLIGAFVCREESPYRYAMDAMLPRQADATALDAAYGFLGDHILADPGRWWAADLLPLMTPVAATDALDNGASA